MFVGSSLDRAQNKLYFFFSETGTEFSYMTELRSARVAQVCKVTVPAALSGAEPVLPR